MTESLKNHFKRRAVVIAERVELELTVAGTEYAPLERNVFKGTKNNTKAPKEKHIVSLNRSISDGDKQAKTVLKMLARRLKEVGNSSISSASLAAGIKTLAVWHRCLNSGDNSFLTLCSQYAHVVEPPASNPLGLLYGAYLRELLACFYACKHAYHRETVFEETRVAKLKPLDLIHDAKCILAMLLKLLECDIQGGLIDPKTRFSVQYVINLLLLDAVPLFLALRTAADRIRSLIGRLSAEDADLMARFYLKYSKIPDMLLAQLKQVEYYADAAPPLTAFDKKTFDSFEKALKQAARVLESDEGSYHTVKSLADLAATENGDKSYLDADEEPLPPVARISLSEIDSEQKAGSGPTSEKPRNPPPSVPSAPKNPPPSVPSAAQKSPQPRALEPAAATASLIDLGLDFAPATAPAAVAAVAAAGAVTGGAVKGDVWDPFSASSPPRAAAAAAAAAPAASVNPFDSPTDPFGGGGGGHGHAQSGGGGGGGGFADFLDLGGVRKLLCVLILINVRLCMCPHMRTRF
jgi:hypothetical protein